MNILIKHITATILYNSETKPTLPENRKVAHIKPANMAKSMIKNIKKLVEKFLLRVR